MSARWDSELCVVRASSREALARAVEAAAALARERADAPLASVALTLAASEGEVCLALVAGSLDELARKAEHAVRKLRDPACRRIHDRSGIFFTEEPLYRPGTVGVLVPGEGCQYPNMLRELCLHFPEVRHAFDLVDRACRQVDEAFTPSAHIFDEPLRALPGSPGTLWNMGAAVEAVSAADTAMMWLFQALGVRVDAVVGHSSGEFVALEMAGVLRFEDDDDKVALIRDGYRNIQALEARADLPEGRMVYVGGLDEAAVRDVLAGMEGRALLAMHNCPNQFVLCAVPHAEEGLTDALAARGGMVQALPFHRPYHTPWFTPALDGIRQLFARRALHPPAIALYSCATADRFPADREGILDRCVGQWTRPVRFDETLRRMHDDGIRLFLDVGARGNLAAFAADVLKGRPHAAIAANRHLRSSLAELHFALAQLAAHGVPLRLDHLHARRGTPPLDAVATKPSRGAVRLASHLPRPSLDLAGLALAPPSAVPGPVPAPVLAPVLEVTEAAPLPDAVRAYFDTMDAFVQTQQRLTARFLDDLEREPR
jgi:acyl transferase domain-containing protein